MRTLLSILICISAQALASAMAGVLPTAGGNDSAESCCCCGAGQPCNCGCAMSRSPKAPSAPPAQIQCRCDEQPAIYTSPAKVPTARLRELDWASASSIADFEVPRIQMTGLMPSFVPRSEFRDYIPTFVILI